MSALGTLLGIGGTIACCGLLFVLGLVALVIWYWRKQPNQKVSATAPQPPIQATIEHPTAATTNVVEPPAPATVPAAPTAPAESPWTAPAAPEPPAPSDPAPPSSDA